MKNIQQLVVSLFALLILVSVVFAPSAAPGQSIPTDRQMVPTGPYVAQPGEENGTDLIIIWQNEATLVASFNQTNGLVDSLMFTSPLPDQKMWTWERYVRSDAPSEGGKLENPDQWKAIANKVRSEFEMLGEKGNLDLYYEVVPYKCTMICRSIDHHETPASTTTAVFEKTTEVGKKVLAFTLDKWYGGPEPVVGQSVVIGQDSRSAYFFSVTKTIVGAVISPEMKQEIARLEKGDAAPAPPAELTLRPLTRFEKVQESANRVTGSTLTDAAPKESSPIPGPKPAESSPIDKK